jgi:hypothetical protein
LLTSVPSLKTEAPNALNFWESATQTKDVFAVLRKRSRHLPVSERSETMIPRLRDFDSAVFVELRKRLLPLAQSARDARKGF